MRKVRKQSIQRKGKELLPIRIRVSEILNWFWIVHWKWYLTHSSIPSPGQSPLKKCTIKTTGKMTNKMTSWKKMTLSKWLVICKKTGHFHHWEQTKRTVILLIHFLKFLKIPTGCCVLLVILLVYFFKGDPQMFFWSREAVQMQQNGHLFHTFYQGLAVGSKTIGQSQGSDRVKKWAHFAGYYVKN